MECITVKNISKRFSLGHRERPSFFKNCLKVIANLFTKKHFWALRDINLTVNKGEVLGIIGKNGSGKTTLLKIISRIITPTKGTTITSGTISPLFNVGAGVNPRFSVKENIMISSVLRGLTIRSAKRRYKRILKFSELEDFEGATLNTLSRGMCQKLAFSVIVHTNFDILILDDFITVGDINFKEKCVSTIKQLQKKGKTIILSSHNLDLIQELCGRCVIIMDGKKTAEGKTKAMIQKYKKIMKKRT